jgi:mannose-1-phosphate guanylyltransferase
MAIELWPRTSHRLTDNYWGIILAGGDGKRLENFLKTEFGLNRPKQFFTIVGRLSMLRHTIDRVSPLIPNSRLLTVISRRHLSYAMADLYDRDPKTIVTVPFNCETAPSILLPLLSINNTDPNAIVTVFPSDHFILEEARFMEYVKTACSFVSKQPEFLTTLGIVPNSPQKGYGWIEKGDLLHSEVEHHAEGMGEKRAYRIRKFWEKPDEELTQYLHTRGCLWNTMTLIGTAATFIRLFKECTPEIFSSFQRIWNDIGTFREAETTYEVFRTLPSVNFSQAILERVPHRLCVLPVNGVYWSDWGDENRIRCDLVRLAQDRQGIHPATVGHAEDRIEDSNNKGLLSKPIAPSEQTSILQQQTENKEFSFLSQ